MSRDNWERLVVAVVRREQIWQMFHSHSISPSISSISSSNSSATLSGQVLLDNGFEPFQISPSRTSSAPALTKTSNKKERLKGTADYGDENRAYLSKAVKKKLEDLSPNVRESVFMLRKLQTQHDDLESEFFRKREALEAKYQKLYQPLYSMRYKMINYNETRNQTDNDDDGVPDFWLTAMRNNVVLSREISKHDEEALKFIEDIQWSRVDYPKGFKLIFHFGPNPFFKNSKLTKTYCITDEIQPVLEKAIGTDIDWYREKNLTQKIKTKKPNKWSKIVNQLIAKTEQCESFFNFFSPPRVAEYEALDEDVAEKIEKLMVKDYEMGLIIRDKIVPHAVSWFTEEATQ